MSQQHEDPPTLDDELLHRYHDGELGPVGSDARASMDARLDEQARAKLAALDDLGSAVRHAVTAGASEGPEGSILRFDAWDAIEAQIAKAPISMLGDRQGSAVASKTLSITDRIRRRRVPIWISTIVAAAAAVLVVFGPWGGSTAVANDFEIESLEATDAYVTVMKLPGDQTTVVWVSHED